MRELTKGIYGTHLARLLKAYEKYMPTISRHNFGDSLVTCVRLDALPPPSLLGGLTGASRVMVKYEASTPLGPSKDRGMTAAMSKRQGKGCQAWSVPRRAIRRISLRLRNARRAHLCRPRARRQDCQGKLSQAIAAGGAFSSRGQLRRLPQSRPQLSTDYPVELVNQSIRRARRPENREFRNRHELGDAPDIHCLPVGNAGTLPRIGRASRSINEAGNTTKLPMNGSKLHARSFWVMS